METLKIIGRLLFASLNDYAEGRKPFNDHLRYRKALLAEVDCICQKELVEVTDLYHRYQRNAKRISGQSAGKIKKRWKFAQKIWAKFCAKHNGSLLSYRRELWSGRTVSVVE